MKINIINIYSLIDNTLLSFTPQLHLKKKKELRGIDNPMGIEDESEVTVKTEANVDTMEAGVFH